MENKPSVVLIISIATNLNLQQVIFYFEVLFSLKECSVFFRTIAVEIQLFFQLPVVVKFQLPKLNKCSWELLDIFTQSFSKIKGKKKNQTHICILNQALYFTWK